MGYRLGNQNLISSRGKRFSLLHNIQPGSGAHKSSYPVGTGALSPEIMRSGCVKITTHLHLVLRSGMEELLSPLPINIFTA
jgi:hypothetical protein